MKKGIQSVLGKQLMNDDGKKGWTPGMSLRNASGDVNVTGLGYDYVIRTTSHLRSKSVQQKFYEVPIADFMTVEVGTGAWMEQITTNLEYGAAGDFESGLINNGSSNADIPSVEVGISPKTYPILSWNMGYMYSIPELEKALASNNWDVIKAKTDALKKRWDLGLQKIGFVGSASITNVEGLLTLSDTTSDTTTLTTTISSLAADDFSAFVQVVVGLFFNNSNKTALPDTFIIPMDDYLGLSAPVSAAFPMNSKAEYLEKAFAQATGNKNFRIVGNVYAMAAHNPDGVNRYMLYRNDPDVVKMDIPVNFNLLSPNTGNNYQWKGVAYGQFTGVQCMRPAETYYMDWN